MVSANHAVRTYGLPGLLLREKVWSKGGSVILYGDNTATIKVLQKGASGTLRHLSRTHRVSIAWLSEVIENRHILPVYAPTNTMKADILKKGFGSATAWNRARFNVNICALEELGTLLDGLGPADDLGDPIM